jgi:type I restriction enzyme M protein
LPEPIGLDLEYSDDWKLIDFLSGDLLEDRPEERVRQRHLRILHVQYCYPKNWMAREVPIQRGSGLLRDAEGKPVQADIVVYESSTAQRARDQGGIRFVVELKAPDEQSGHNQLVSYVFLTSANGAVLYNGESVGRRGGGYRRAESA